MFEWPSETARSVAWSCWRSSTRDEFWIDNVAVHPAHQGTGVGRALLAHAEVVAQSEGFDAVHLLTHERMTENLALYTRVGYVEYERRPPGSPVLVCLRKRLGG